MPKVFSPPAIFKFTKANGGYSAANIDQVTSGSNQSCRFFALLVEKCAENWHSGIE